MVPCTATHRSRSWDAVSACFMAMMCLSLEASGFFFFFFFSLARSSASPNDPLTLLFWILVYAIAFSAAPSPSLSCMSREIRR